MYVLCTSRAALPANSFQAFTWFLNYMLPRYDATRTRCGRETQCPKQVYEIAIQGGGGLAQSLGLPWAGVWAASVPHDQVCASGAALEPILVSEPILSTIFCSRLFLFSFLFFF